MKKKILSLALFLALVLALAVPAFAAEITLEDVNCSVAPIGVATISNGRTDESKLEHTNVYVFDQSTSISLKDGTGFVMYDFWDWTTWGADSDGGIFGQDDEGNFLVYEWIDFAVDSEERDFGRVYKLRISFDWADGGFWAVSKPDFDRIKKMGWTVEFTPLEQPTQPSTPTQPKTPAQAGTYTAKAGDTWGQLALNNYGTYAVWPQLMRANGNKAVSVGMTVTLPEKIGSYSLLPAQVLTEGEMLYTVKGGDTLGQIALAAYGDMSLYKIIYERNKDRLTSPAMIYGGQTLVLPVKPAAQAPAQPEQSAESGQPVSFAKGDKVTVREGAKTYTGGNLASFVYKNTYTVIAVNGDRVVIGINGVATAAMNAADLVSAK